MQQVGRPVPGRTNAPLAAGRGTFVDDVQLPHTAHMAVLRSPYAHARILGVDATAARRYPGVLLVVTGEEIRTELNPIPEAHDSTAVGARSATRYCLAVDRVRYVGEPVAAVVAEDRWAAHEALQLIDVDYEELPAAVEAEAALQPGAPLVEPAWGTNLMLEKDFRAGDPAAAFAAADGTLRGTVRSGRITGAPIETRACLADYDPYRDRLTFWDATQNAHPLRYYLA